MEYRFLTSWLLQAERERVWNAIYDSEAWPGWWRGVQRVNVIVGGEDSGVGQVGRYTWRSKLPYDLSFEMRTTRVENARDQALDEPVGPDRAPDLRPEPRLGDGQRRRGDSRLLGCRLLASD